jgi:hypothetical protein
MPGPVKATFILEPIFRGAVRGAGGMLMRDDLAPGACRWARDEQSNVRNLAFACPCGCGYIGACPLSFHPEERGWVWCGDTDLPTLTPSIKMLSPCGWHGYLKRGVFEPCT